MLTKVTARHKEEYRRDGCTILRDVIPPGLLQELRRECDVARHLARRQGGPQCQRLQPVYKYAELRHAPFREFLALPGMSSAVAEILGAEHRPSDIMGVLLEPANQPWCTPWHRDWAYNSAGVDLDAFWHASRDLRLFNQLNAALYDDQSLWFVPGSHNREDSELERTRFPKVPPPGPELPESLSNEERELACLTYARSMPGATPISLFAGDVAFYRASAWHLGSYVPYASRATLHDGFYCEVDYAWQRSVRDRQAAMRKD